MKKLLIGVLVFVLVIAIGSGLLWSNLDRLVQSAIEKYGSAATQASVHVDSVSLSLGTGEGSLNDLTVGNPKGFDTPYALNMNNIAVKIDTASLSGDGPIMIDDITIKNPKVYYEISARNKNNLDTLSANAAAYTGDKESAARTANAGTETKGEGRKIIIKNLLIEGGEISISHYLLKDQAMSTKLPQIHLTNLGQKNKGITPAEVADQVMKALTRATSRAAAGTIATELGDLKDLPAGVLEGAGSGLDAVKGLFGK